LAAGVPEPNGKLPPQQTVAHCRGNKK
jgi:hypothetical protein